MTATHEAITHEQLPPQGLEAELHRLQDGFNAVEVPTLQQLGEGQVALKAVKVLNPDTHEYSDAEGRALDANLVEGVDAKYDPNRWILSDEELQTTAKVAGTKNRHHLTPQENADLEAYAAARQDIKGEEKPAYVFTQYKRYLHKRMALSDELLKLKAEVEAPGTELAAQSKGFEIVDDEPTTTGSVTEYVGRHRREKPEPTVYYPTTDFDPIDESRIIDMEPVSDDAEGEESAPIDGANLRGAHDYHAKHSDSGEVTNQGADLDTRKFDEEGTEIISAAEKAAMHEDDRALSERIKQYLREPSQLKPLESDWSDPTYTDTNDKWGEVTLTDTNEKWGETTLTDTRRSLWNRAVGRAWAKLQELKARGSAYFGDEEKGSRRKKILGGVIGAGALIGAGVAIYMEAKGGSVSHHAATPKHEVHVPKPAHHEHLEAAHLTLGHHGDTIWNEVSDLAKNHGVHMSETQAHHIVGEVLKANGQTWESARHLPIDYKFHVSPHIEEQILKLKRR